jgi:hypothetical protein
LGEALWQEAEPVVERENVLLILDDTTLDKPYANKIEHVTWHWSGKHGKAVKGINLPTLLWRGSAENGTSEEEATGKASRMCRATFACTSKAARPRTGTFATCSIEPQNGTLLRRSSSSTVSIADLTT